ncbi:MAG: TolC family protein [Ignavibacterium sp.]
MNKLKLFISILLIVFSEASFSQNNKLNLDSLISEAIQNNPQLKALRNQVIADESKVGQVSAWESPQIGVEFFNTPIQSFPNPFENQMEYDYFIQQMFPFPGKIGNMKKAAQNNASMTNQEYYALEKKIIRDLESSYYELFFIQKKIEINKDNQELMNQFVEIATRQYEVGLGKQPDIIRAQTELSTLINEGINLQKEETDAKTMINVLLNRQANSPLGIVPEVNDTIPNLTYEKVSQLGFENRPELKGMQFNIEMNKSELAVSKREYYPDLMVRLMYKNMTNTGNDFWSAMFGVNVPFAFWSNNKFSKKVEENEANIKKAEEDYNSMKNMIAYEVQNALVKLETSRNLKDLSKNTIIPQATQTLQSTTAAYQTGKTEFLMVLDAYKMLFMSRLDYYMYLTNFMQAKAQLEQAVGLNLKEIISN